MQVINMIWYDMITTVLQYDMIWSQQYCNIITTVLQYNYNSIKISFQQNQNIITTKAKHYYNIEGSRHKGIAQEILPKNNELNDSRIDWLIIRKSGIRRVQFSDNVVIDLYLTFVKFMPRSR